MLILLALIAALPSFLVPSCSFDFLDFLNEPTTASEEEEEEEEYTSEEEIEVDTSEEELEESVSYYDSDLVVHFLNVGQGDTTFIELPNGETMLIDAGSDEYGGDVAMYIDALGYSTIDYVVATHPDDDHIGGMPEVLSLLSVGEVWAPDVDETSQTYEDFLDAVDGTGLALKEACSDKYIISDDDLTVEILGPASSCDSDDMDDWSVVIFLRYDENTFLFCSDAAAGDIDNWTRYTNVDDWLDLYRGLDVLKVAQHGGGGGMSSSLMNELSPEIAVISYDENNTDGLPNKGVLENLEEAGADIYGTAVNGTIVVTSDGKYVHVACNQEGTVEAGEVTDDNDSSSSTTTLDEEEKTVYITATGSKYHRRKSCNGLNNANEIYETTLSEAEAAGFEPCGICW